MSHHDHPSHDAPQPQKHGNGEPRDNTHERDDVEHERAQTAAGETKAGLK